MSDHMKVLDAGQHEEECKRFETGWLCTTTCKVEVPQTKTFDSALKAAFLAGAAHGSQEVDGDEEAFQEWRRIFFTLPDVEEDHEAAIVLRGVQERARTAIPYRVKGGVSELEL